MAEFPVTSIRGSPLSRRVLGTFPPTFRRKPECREFFEDLLTRLAVCHNAVANHEDDEWRTKYGDILKRFMKLRCKQPVLERLAGAETIAYTVRELHSNLDEIYLRVGRTDANQWVDDWDRGCEEQATQLQLLIDPIPAFGLIREMSGDQNVITAMLEMYASLEERTPRPLTSLKRSTLEKLRIALNIEARVISAETVADIDGQPTSILSVFRWFISERDVEIKEGYTIGAGTYGIVTRGKWTRRDGSIMDVVIKSLFDQSIGSETSFLRQLQLWYELPKHPNILHLLGGCHRARQPFFVCENAPGGNIFQFFSKPKNHNVFWSMFLQVAEGLKHLHDNHIVHDGLKSGNILIGENNIPKISDFDSSRVRALSASFSNKSVEASKYSVRYKPRERLVESNAPPLFKSDVYSLGMCILEAKTQISPFGMYDDDEVMEKIMDREPLERPDELLDEEWSVISQLIATDIEDRPDMSEVINLIACLVPGAGVGA